MDSGLVAKARKGDLTAFATLAKPMYPRLNRVAYSIMGDQTAAEDATQQAMLNVWRHLPQLRDTERFEPWCFQALTNACRSEWRRRKRWQQDSAGGELPDRPGPDAYGSVIDRERLDRGFERLTLEHRTVLVLFYYADMSHEQIAEILGVAVGTARSRLHRATAAMQAALEAAERIGQTRPANVEPVR